VHGTTAGLIQSAGVATSLADSGQQWDAPNAWPPLQDIVIEALQSYGGALRPFRCCFFPAFVSHFPNWLTSVNQRWTAFGLPYTPFSVKLLVLRPCVLACVRAALGSQLSFMGFICCRVFLYVEPVSGVLLIATPLPPIANSFLL
jgi:Trehalase